MERRPLHRIAREIIRDWTANGKSVHYAAAPYLNAMRDMETVDEPYYNDSGKSVVRYFLANAQSWKGEKAKAIKAELKEMVK